MAFGNGSQKSDCGQFDSDDCEMEVGDASIEKATNEEIDLVVTHIRRLTRVASLEFALRVGSVIIHHFYDGDTDAWRSRGPKVSSFRRLARHPDLPMSAGALYRCVALYELCDRLHAASRWEHLGASHLRLVIGLPAATQEKLLATANANRWTVKVLHEQVMLQKSERSERGGRRAQPAIAKSLLSVRKCLSDHRHVISQAGSLTAQDVEHSIQLVEEARASLDALSQSLHAVMSSCGTRASEGEVHLLMNGKRMTIENSEHAARVSELAHHGHRSR
jgi:hypothetical protein